MIREMLIQLPMLAISGTDKSRMRQSGGAEGNFAANTADMLKNFDWRWLMYFITAALLVFGIILFSALAMRRMQASRLSFFIVTIGVLIIRVLRPTEIAWKIAAGAGVVLSILFFLSVLKAGKQVDKKEPIFYLLNIFSFVLLCMPVQFYEATLIGLSVFMSLFFLTAKTPRSADRYTKNTADPFIVSQLEKRSKRKH